MGPFFRGSRTNTYRTNTGQIHTIHIHDKQTYKLTTYDIYMYNTGLGGGTFLCGGSHFYNRKVTHGSLFHGGHFSI